MDGNFYDLLYQHNTEVVKLKMAVSSVLECAYLIHHAALLGANPQYYYRPPSYAVVLQQMGGEEKTRSKARSNPFAAV